VITEREDDFRVFDGQEHMFFGIANPWGFIRYEIEEALRSSPPHFQVEQITAYDTPKFLTLCREADADGNATISHYGFSFKAKLKVSHPQVGTDVVMDMIMTCFFADIDQPKPRKVAIFDLKNTEGKFTDEIFTERFIQFRYETDSEEEVGLDSREPESKKPWWQFW
jgi:hypothetical protein